MVAEVLRFPVERARAGRWRDKHQVAEHFGVSTRTVNRWMAQGCPHVKGRGGMVRFRLEAVEAWFGDRP